MDKLTGNESVFPEIDSEERGGESWWVQVYSSGGITIRQEFASRQMAAYRSCNIHGALPSESLAKFAVIDADALIAALNKEVNND